LSKSRAEPLKESNVVQRLHQARERVAARVRRGESGFTLIELLIVIVILGVLAGIVVFAVGAFNDRGQNAACKADIKNVEVAVEAYKAKRGSYPTDINFLLGASPDPNNVQYLRALPALSEAAAGTAGKSYYITYNATTGGVTGSIVNAGGADPAC
jgi:type II secretion system protein G